MESKKSRQLDALETQLIDILTGYGRLGVAFSGGVDSTLLLAAARRALGDNVYALTAVSPIHPAGEKELAIDLARKLGVRHILFESHELEDSAFVSNPTDRCYHCKMGMLKAMRVKADELGITTLAHGANTDDLSDYRPGFRAAREMGVVAPLIDAEMTKAQIRQLADHWGLPNWNRPAMACLATRVPYGVAIDIDVLRRIDHAEQFLNALGVVSCRVRDHGDLARIEVASEEIERLARPPMRQQISEAFHKLGYTHISLDLEGYVSGKMNTGVSPG